MSHSAQPPAPGPDSPEPGGSGRAAGDSDAVLSAPPESPESTTKAALRPITPKRGVTDPAGPDPHDVGAALRIGVGVLVRRLRAMKAEEGDVTLPESAALTRLDRGGPATAAALARAEQISPQAMGATLAALEARGLVTRAPDPGDGRRLVLSVSAEGLEVLRHRRSRRTQELADALAEGFTADELRTLLAAAPLLERLADRL